MTYLIWQMVENYQKIFKYRSKAFFWEKNEGGSEIAIIWYIR